MESRPYSSVIAFCIFSSFASASDLIDLTHPFNKETIYWPTAKGFELEKRGWKVTEKADIYGIENVANSDQLPPRGATLYVAPMKIEQGTGAPARIIVVVP